MSFDMLGIVVIVFSLYMVTDQFLAMRMYVKMANERKGWPGEKSLAKEIKNCRNHCIQWVLITLVVSFVTFLNIGG
jgi:hypothetical protein